MRLLLPGGGVSALDSPSQKLHDPTADEALFKAFKINFKTNDTHRLIRAPHHINDAAFVEIVERHVRALMPARAD